MDSALQPTSGSFEGTCHLMPCRVYYEDTDLSGVVYHANYLRYCERARTELLRLLGIEQRGTQESGGGVYAVADAQIRWLAPAKLDDSLVVQTRLAELGAATVRLDQAVCRGDEVLVQVAIRVGFIGPDGRPRRQPAEWRAAFADFYGKETR
jgi:acyl-CoA thioester hydrolase